MKQLFLFITACIITISTQAQTVRKMKMFEFSTMGAAQEAQTIISDALLGVNRTAVAVDFQQWDGQVIDSQNQPRNTGLGEGNAWYIWVDADNEAALTLLAANNTDLKNIVGITTVNGSVLHDWQRIDPLN